VQRAYICGWGIYSEFYGFPILKTISFEKHWVSSIEEMYYEIEVTLYFQNLTQGWFIAFISAVQRYIVYDNIYCLSYRDENIQPFVCLYPACGKPIIDSINQANFCHNPLLF